MHVVTKFNVSTVYMYIKESTAGKVKQRKEESEIIHFLNTYYSARALGIWGNSSKI
jgi:hypothetical protein